MTIDELIYLQNPWWNDPEYVPREINLPRRFLFKQFLEEVKNTKQISGLVGLRRVGKSTLLKQIVGSLLRENTRPQEILYFSFDQPLVEEDPKVLESIISFHLQKILNQKIHKIHQKVYLFFDEIQLIPYWQDILKRFYDLNQNLKFVVSGSASLLLINNAKESLTGRIFQRKLGPLSFSEYQFLSGRKDLVEFLNYGQFPELLEFTTLEKKREYLKDSVVGKVLEVDIPKIYRLRKIFDFERLFWSLLVNSGQIISSSRLMSDLGLKKATLFKYLTILEQSLLINKVLNLSGSFRSEKRLLRKLYPACSNFLTLSPQLLPIDFFVETYVASLLTTSGKNFFLYRLRDKEIDFILPEEKLAIEVKFQNKVSSRDYKTLSSFIREKNYRGLIITKNQDEILKNENIQLINLENVENFFNNL